MRIHTVSKGLLDLINFCSEFLWNFQILTTEHFLLDFVFWQMLTEFQDE